MNYKIIMKIERAGNSNNKQLRFKQWDLLYGENNWCIVYKYNNEIITREEALNKIYEKSYYIYLKNNPEITDELCSLASDIYNPHTKNTGGIDLQCPAVYKALNKLNKTLYGTQSIAIGTYGAKHGKKYPNISYVLSPFKVPVWFDKNISVEYFWQNYKYLALKE